jgi:carbamoyltransferase
MSQLILGVHTGFHDATAVLFEDYTLKAAVQLERLTRVKGDASNFPQLCIDEVLAIAGADRRDVAAVAFGREQFPNEVYRRPFAPLWSFLRSKVRGRPTRGLAREIRIRKAARPEDVIDPQALLRHVGLPETAAAHFFDHHEAHALPALFYTDWDDALLVTADGAGDNINYSHRHFAQGKLTTIYGDEDCWHRPLPPDSLGQLYAAATVALGYRSNRHEGKLTGLAAMGEPSVYDRIAPKFTVDENGRVHSGFARTRDMLPFMRELAKHASRQDVAASVQKVVEDTMLPSLQRLLARYPARRLGRAGGLFANVKLNQLLAEKLPLDEIFVFPAMGDDGLATGGVLAHLLRRDGLDRWLQQRRKLNDVYLGRDYTAGIDAALAATPGVVRRDGAPVELAAARLTNGEIGAIYTGRMEYGPRALGARTILANPARRETHDLLNQRLDRTEFMPFAPVVAEERAAEVFEVDARNAYACRFMTITCRVREAWRTRIPAVVHVDGTARPQIISRASNPLYYDIVTAFERVSGLPVLVNTSFNVHEEPIVNAPAECIRALTDGRIDFVVTNGGLYELAARTS